MHSPNKTDQSLLSIGAGIDFTLRALEYKTRTAHQQDARVRALMTNGSTGSAWQDE
ncbi:hypothetical protein PSCICO_19660 [Pseudomonas cichorii]|nr:hypothetical protein PSCICO_19660 [Pseudomonas cichorii]